jgi:hypothetical protein
MHDLRDALMKWLNDAGHYATIDGRTLLIKRVCGFHYFDSQQVLQLFLGRDGDLHLASYFNDDGLHDWDMVFDPNDPDCFDQIIQKHAAYHAAPTSS